MEFAEIATRLMEIFCRHKGKTLGIVFGFVVSVLFLLVGFFKTFFILSCCAIGYFVGKKIDNREDFREIIDRILPPHD